jgi:hypothetical protein
VSRLKRILNPERSERQELVVSLPPEGAIEACRAAAKDLQWKAREDGERRLKVMEDFTKLHCGDAPLLIEIEVTSENGGSRSKVDVEGTLPGAGGVTNKHLAEGMKVFSLYVGLNAKALGG